jgi:hypothetical protein
MLDDFIQLISRDGGSLSDASAVAQSAEEVREEMTKPAPKWTAVRTILTSIAGAVTEISTLAAAVKDIQALVTHITG